MSAMSDYLENKIIDAVFRGQALPTIGNTWIALTSTPVVDSNTGTNITEIPNSGGYARVQLTSNLTNWMGTNFNQAGTISSGTNGTVSNNVAITFPSPTGSWGVANSFALLDSGTWGAGNLLFYGQLTAPKTINAGDAAPTFTANTLQIQIDN